MNPVRIIVTIALPVLLAAADVCAQSADPDNDTSNRVIGNRAGQAQHEQAVAAARKAIEVAETSLGPNHPYVAISLNDLASLYVNSGEYAKAEPLYERSLAIWEAALGPDHPYVANCLNNLSDVYRAVGKEQEAREVEERRERIRTIKQK